MMNQHILHGGDYNPDQWLDCPEVLAQDIELMKQAHVNCVTLGVFAWSRLEPEEGRFDFDWLEKIMDNLYENGIYTIFATPTGAMPRWLTDNYEEVNKVREDGMRRIHGQRHNFCPSSPVMRKRMRLIDGKLAERFAGHPGLIAWHISNEYGGDAHTDCHCPYCQAAFREWLKERYGTLEKLNHAWWTQFWSNTVTDWEQIHSPADHGETILQGLKIDWKRFTSERLLDFCKAEKAAVREYSDAPTVVNMMGTFKPLDYFKWAKELDIVSYDSYPFWHYMEDESQMASIAAFCYALTRSMKKQPFLLMESVPSAVNWMPRCILKRPGMHALSSLQAVAYGADSVQYFQWRKSRGGAEKYHGAVIDHKNGGNTRVFQDVSALGERLEKLSGRIKGTCNKPAAALVFDWENWWAVEDAGAVLHPFDYRRKVLDYYQAFWDLGIDADIIDMDSSLDGYALVVAPINYMYRGDYAERVREYVQRGGTYVTTYWSGEVDDSDLCFLDSHPLRELLGVRTEEIDVRPQHVPNRVMWQGKGYAIKDLCALVHSETAEVLGTYELDFYAGYPALTRNSFGKGKAYYVAAECGTDFLEDFYCMLAEETGAGCTLSVQLTAGVTVSERKGPEGSLWFVQNFNSSETEIRFEAAYRDAETGESVSGAYAMAPYQCLILEGNYSAV